MSSRLTREEELRAASTRAVLTGVDRSLGRTAARLELRRAELELECTDQRIRELHLQIDNLESQEYQQRRK